MLDAGMGVTFFVSPVLVRGKARKVPQDRFPLAKRGCYGDCWLDFTACFPWQSTWPTETPFHQEVPHAQVRG